MLRVTSSYSAINDHDSLITARASASEGIPLREDCSRACTHPCLRLLTCIPTYRPASGWGPISRSVGKGAVRRAAGLIGEHPTDRIGVRLDGTFTRR